MFKAFATDPGYGYSQSVRAGDQLFVSGQVAWDKSGTIQGVGDIEVQTRWALKNLETALRMGGSDLSHVAKLNIYSTSALHLDAIRRIRHEFFDPVSHYPASTYTVVSALAHPDLLIEVEAVGYVDQQHNHT